MHKDLHIINEEIDVLLRKPPSMEKYTRLSTLLICKEFFEMEAKTKENTVEKILDYKMEQIGARATLLKLEPILADHIKTIEAIAPTISGEFIKKIREM
jgi:hypothetical protein